ncbi:hypothetical protein D3C73_1040220 [compost metagenome]
MDLHKQCGAAAKNMPAVIPGQVSFIPAIPQPRTYSIVTCCNLRCNIISLHLQPLTVAGPARGQITIAYAQAVEFQFIQSQGGRIHSGLKRFSSGLKAAPKERTALRFYTQQ